MRKSTEAKSRRKSTKSTKAAKPDKPYAGFPMFAHDSGMWAKKIRKRLVYFTSWRLDSEGEKALERFNREWPFLKDGRTPPPVDVSNGCTLCTLCNDFLRSKEDNLNAGDLSPRTFRDYYRTCEALIDHFGKERIVSDLRPDDFRAYRAKLAKRYGVVSHKNEINRVCIVFNHAHENNLIDKPVSYGKSFDRPSAKALRRVRNQAGPNLFEADEIRTIIDALDGKPVIPNDKGESKSIPADPVLKAAVLLAANAGFGNADVASLPQSAVDLETGWIEFPDRKRRYRDVSRCGPKPSMHCGLPSLHVRNR